ncbi:MAG: N-acetylmuramoyl-L-alanine amidase [Acidobacteriota bacterium]|nr:N-acetylmuramoyl-L-alanine amidase [Acidobacteriota bacterium]
MAIVLLTTIAPAGSQSLGDTLTLISNEGRRVIQTVTIDGRPMVALTELAEPFGLSIEAGQESGRLTIFKNQIVMVLTANDGIVSVAGRLEALTAPPVERRGVWYVPIDFIGRALPLVHNETVDLRPRSRLVIVGDIRVPQVVARYQRSGSGARLRFMVTPAAEPSVTQTANQLMIAFDADALDLVTPDLVPDELLRTIRGDETSARLTLQLGESFGGYGVSSAPALGGSSEVVIELNPLVVSPTVPPLPTAPQTAEASPGDTNTDLPAIADLSQSQTVRAVAIDPGHGGADTGSAGPEGTLEKDVTLSVARRLRNAIQRQLGLRVVLTRNDDTDVSLDERAAIANNNRADLFISLHANASMRETAVGAEVFYLSQGEYANTTSETLSNSGQPVPVAGGGSRVLDVVPWEMTQLRFIGRSEHWAQTITDALSLLLPMSPRGLQQAPFRVLVGANMPAALIEMGFLSNPDQEVQLSSSTFQDAVVNGLLRSIVRYRDDLERGLPKEPGPPTDEPEPRGNRLP